MTTQTAALNLKYNSAELFRKEKRGNAERKKIYMEWVKLARSKGTNPRDLKPELDSKDVLHYHGVIDYPKTWSYNTLRQQVQMDGMQVFVTDLYEPVGWKQYTEKDQGKVPVKDPVVTEWRATPENVLKEIYGASALLRSIPRDQIEFGFGI